jgi:hypothetical protein
MGMDILFSLFSVSPFLPRNSSGRHRGPGKTVDLTKSTRPGLSPENKFDILIIKENVTIKEI